jgi:ApaG protein
MDATSVLSHIKITVTSRYLTVPTQYMALSHARQKPMHLFHYDIGIHNHSADVVAIFSKYWVAIDAKGNEQVLENEGMMIKQSPLLAGQEYIYQGMCQLATPEGVVAGLVGIQFKNGDVQWIPIPKHTLCRPVRLVMNDSIAVS